VTASIVSKALFFAAVSSACGSKTGLLVPRRCVGIEASQALTGRPSRLTQTLDAGAKGAIAYDPSAPECEGAVCFARASGSTDGFCSCRCAGGTDVPTSWYVRCPEHFQCVTAFTSGDAAPLLGAYCVSDRP
jgi:hypothetical protein